MGQQAYEARTVPSNGTVVEDRLKPTVELHILVGGPYTAGGEEHRYGHTALRIKGPGADTTYDFGRYGDRFGMFEEYGEGILRVWNDFGAYIKAENALGRTTMGFVYAVFPHQAAATTAHMDQLLQSGHRAPHRDRQGMKAHKLASDYYALGPNCTTLSVDAAKLALPNIDSGAAAYNKPYSVLGAKERVGLLAKGGSPRLFLPANLQDFLTAGSPVKAVRVDRYFR